MKKQFLSFGFSVKDVKGSDKKGTFEGYASTFGNIDLGGDRVEKGAFRRTIKNSKGHFKILADHSPSDQIGFNLEAEEDDKGLWVKGELLIDDIPKAREKYAIAKKAIELGTDIGLSIGYFPVKWDIDTDKESGQQFRRLKEIRLVEYSFVAFPMNEMASVTAVKQMEELFNAINGDEQDLVKNFIALLKKNGFTDVAIKSALERSAESLNNSQPPSLAHLFREGLEKLKD
jgi:HK97 family phage prohead protease